MAKVLQGGLFRKKKGEDSPDSPTSPERADSRLLDEMLEKEDDDVNEEDVSKILNMSLVKSILGNSTSALDESVELTADGVPTRVVDIKKSVSFSGVDSVGSFKDDDEKTREELIAKIGKLKAKLNQAEIDHSGEKAMRKKKDKNLVKLAKELNKRAADQKEKERAINGLKNVIGDLEAKLTSTRSEMDERIAANEKKTKEYNQQLDDAHQKFRNASTAHDAKISEMNRERTAEVEALNRASKEAEIECERLRTQIGQVKEQANQKEKDSQKAVNDTKAQLAEAQQKHKKVVKEHDTRIAELSKKHSEQIDDLRRQLLASNLECDKIRTTLASHQMKASPDEADAIVSRTMRSASFAEPKRKKGIMLKLMPVFQAAGIVCLVMTVIAYQLGLLSMGSVCAPAMPGTVLDEETFHEAPWWAPKPYKEGAFSICGERPRTSLQWSNGRLVVADTESSKVLLDKRANFAVVHAGVINFFAKNGRIESSQSPWSK